MHSRVIRVPEPQRPVSRRIKKRPHVLPTHAVAPRRRILRTGPGTTPRERHVGRPQERRRGRDGHARPQRRDEKVQRYCFGVFCVNEASACGVFVDERRVTDERGGFETVLTLAVRDDLGGFELFALERRVNEDLGGIDQH